MTNASSTFPSKRKRVMSLLFYVDFPNSMMKIIAIFLIILCCCCSSSSSSSSSTIFNSNSILVHCQAIENNESPTILDHHHHTTSTAATTDNDINDTTNNQATEYDDYEDNMTLFNKYTGLNTTLLASIIISKDEILKSMSNSYPTIIAVENINIILSYYGVPYKSLLSTDEFVVAILTIIITLLMYYFCMGKRHVKKRKMLAADLKIAQEKVSRL